MDMKHVLIGTHRLLLTLSSIGDPVRTRSAHSSGQAAERLAIALLESDIKQSIRCMKLILRENGRGQSTLSDQNGLQNVSSTFILRSHTNSNAFQQF